MGLVRTLLAIAVVLDHSHAEYNLVGGQNAVQMFYMISGFLISFVIVERNTYPHKSSFYINRYLRLYPVYGVVALASLFWYTIFDPLFLDRIKSMPDPAKIWLFLSNLVIFGQDWILFSGVRSGELSFMSQFRESEVQLWKGLLVPQAWTLGVELSFYLIAPWILTRVRWIFLLMVVSISLRLCFFYFGFGMKDPWSYRFFPTELAVFLLGALLHQFAYPIAKLIRRPLESALPFSWISVLLVFLAVISYRFWPFSELFKTLILFSIFIPALPFMFIFQHENKLDRNIGELSYPIYICHWLIISVVTYCYEHFGLQTSGLCFIAIILFASISTAQLLNMMIAKPFEKIRSRIRGF